MAKFVEDPPVGFMVAMVGRVERDVLPGLARELVEAWRAGVRSWQIDRDDGGRLAVSVYVTTGDGVVQIARLDAASVGVVLDGDQLGWAG